MHRKRANAFSLLEMLISVSILGLLVVLVTSLFNAATNITSQASKRMDADSELRPLFNRIAVDLAGMVKRSDVPSYAKSQSAVQNGNDQIAFYSLVDGYFPMSTAAEKRQPQTTLVAYRINASNQLERMAKGLAFAGQHSSPPLLFGTGNEISTHWPAATSGTAADPDYNPVAAGVFRFEYYYVLRSGGGTSAAPWASTAQINFTEVAAVAVNVAVIDARSRGLLTTADLSGLGTRLANYESSMGTSGLAAEWQSTINGTTNLPRAALQNIRVFQRIFAL